MEEDLESGIKQGKALVNVQKQTGWVDDVDISRWVKETFETAKRYVYAAPINDGKTADVVSARPDEAYHKRQCEWQWNRSCWRETGWLRY